MCLLSAFDFVLFRFGFFVVVFYLRQDFGGGGWCVYVTVLDLTGLIHRDSPASVSKVLGQCLAFYCFLTKNQVAIVKCGLHSAKDGRSQLLSCFYVVSYYIVSCPSTLLKSDCLSPCCKPALGKDRAPLGVWLMLCCARQDVFLL